MKTPAFRLTVAATLVAAASVPVSNVHAQQSASCSRLMTMVDEAGGNELREEFGDARAVAEADDPNECSVYVARVVSTGGLTMADGAEAQGVTTIEGQGSESETVEIEREATIEGEVEVTLPDPDVQVEQDPADVAVRTTPPEVNVSQGQPTITIRQAQPIIRVQMAQPTITVEQPAPEIVVTMPEPGVNVATAQPTVDVTIPEPRVTVTQGDPQLAVNLDANVGDGAESEGGSNTTLERNDTDGVMTVTANGLSSGANEPNIQYVESEEPPTINIEGAEPQVDYVAAEPDVAIESEGEPTIELVESGEPKIVIRQAGDDEGAALESEAAEGEQQVAALASDAAEEPAEQRDPRDAFATSPDIEGMDGAENGVVTVGELDGMAVINARGEDLGEVERVVRNGNDTYMIVEHGGWFFGLNDKEFALPLSDVTVRQEQVVLRGLTEEQIESLPDYDYANEVALETEDEVTLQRVN